MSHVRLSLAVAPCLLLAALAPTAVAATPVVPASRATPTVKIAAVDSGRALDARSTALLPGRIAAAPPLRGAHAVLAVDPVTGATLFTAAAATPMRGASTTKLATAATTLLVQGTTTRWATRVVAGRNEREVVLVAGGDPLLTSGQLASLAKSTAAVLVTRLPAAPLTPSGTPTRVAFAVTVDDTLYAAPTLAPGWPTAYVPDVVSPVRPLVRDLQHHGDTSVDAAVYFSTQLSAALVTALAARHDVTVSARFTGRLTAATGATLLAAFRGNTSGAALAHMLLVSDNDTAERLFRNNALALGKPATWGGASAAETATLVQAGVDVRGFALYDGSGVSRSDRVTARGLVSLLRLAMSPSHPKLLPLRGYLPVGGRSGTLASRYSTAPTRCAAGKVFAKTGTLHDAIALAGYALGRDGRLRVFAVLDVPRESVFTPNQTRVAVDGIPTTLTGCW